MEHCTEFKWFGVGSLVYKPHASPQHELHPVFLLPIRILGVIRASAEDEYGASTLDYGVGYMTLHLCLLFLPFLTLILIPFSLPLSSPSHQPIGSPATSPLPRSRPAKLPRRLSSTPKAPTAPLLDLSLEEAVFTDPSSEEQGREGGELQLRELETDNGGWRDKFVLARKTKSKLSQVDVSSSRATAGSKSKGKRSGLTVSFVQDDQARPTDEDGRANRAELSYSAEKDLGTSLIKSLNSSRFGALDRSLSQSRRTHTFPRKYRGDDPRLGYDWIAGLLDSDSYLAEHDEEYFEEMKEFRRVNTSECCMPKEAL